MGMHDEVLTFRAALWLTLSILLNMVLYWMIGVLVSLLWSRSGKA